MEQIRLILAIVLSILVFLIWDFFFVSHPPPPQDTQDRRPPVQEKKQSLPVDQKKRETEGVQGPWTKLAERAAASPETAVAPGDRKPETVATVDTPLYTAQLSDKGAVITGMVLKKYRENNGSDAPLKRLIAPDNPFGLLAVDLEGAGLRGVDTGHYELLHTSGNYLQVTRSHQTLVFSKAFDRGVVIEKRYTFFPDSYLMHLEVILRNGSSSPLGGNLSVLLSKRFTGEGGRFVFEGPSAFSNQHLTEVKIKEIAERDTVAAPLDWVAIQSRYFMSAIVPPRPEPAAMRLFSRQEEDFTFVGAKYVRSTETVAPHSSQSLMFKVFMGPKSIPILKEAGNNLDQAVKFGWFDIIARPCLWLMNFIYRFIPNYGVAIIIVTIIIKLIFWPLGNKSYKSMGEMKKLQPLMAEIREKYKDDKKKMNEEMMGLYKTYKINPLGGCLPMLVQIPVFIAFYRMLYQSIELRHAPFLLWIDDLSAPERLFAFDVNIPFMHPPAGIPVMTIIMGATMFLQQKLQPVPGDPSQAKIMMLMPIMLTVIFINFPSGLVLYFLVNNFISIAQQHYITKKNS